MKAGSRINLLTGVLWTSFCLAALTMFSYVLFAHEASWRITLVALLVLAQIFAKVFRIGYEREIGIRR